MKIYPREDRCCIDIMIESLFQDQTVSWFRIVNSTDKYVTGTSEEISIENVQLFISTGRPMAKAKPRPKPVVNLSSNYVLVHERIWTDIDPQPFNHVYFAVSKFKIRLLRHNSIREGDGAVRFDDVIEKVQGKVRWHFAMDSKCLGEFSGPRRRREETVSILFEPLFVQSIPALPNNSGTFRRNFR